MADNVPEFTGDDYQFAQHAVIAAERARCLISSDFGGVPRSVALPTIQLQSPFLTSLFYRQLNTLNESVVSGRLDEPGPIPPTLPRQLIAAPDTQIVCSQPTGYETRVNTRSTTNKGNSKIVKLKLTAQLLEPYAASAKAMDTGDRAAQRTEDSPSMATDNPTAKISKAGLSKKRKASTVPLATPRMAKAPKLSALSDAVPGTRFVTDAFTATIAEPLTMANAVKLFLDLKPGYEVLVTNSDTNGLAVHTKGNGIVADDHAATAQGQTEFVADCLPYFIVAWERNGAEEPAMVTVVVAHGWMVSLVCRVERPVGFKAGAIDQEKAKKWGFRLE
ncbi:MAG: hypothetical protein MMC23_002963 [Stictis urceolatum]|nr:hypothetical protein [Stictis urceolata]